MALPLCLGWLTSLWLSVFSYFRFLFVLPAFYLLVAVGLSRLKQKWWGLSLTGVALVVNLVCTGIYFGNPRLNRENWREAVAFMEEESEGKKAAAIFVTRNQRDAFVYYAKQVESYGPEGIGNDYEKLWLVRYVQPIFDPKDEVRKEIESLGYETTEEKDFNGVTIFGYEK